MGDPSSPNSCLDEVQVLAYLDGRLASDDRQRVTAHLIGCDRCREWVAAVAATTGHSLDNLATEPGEPPSFDARVPPGASGRYTAIASLGKGAMGEVYRAFDSVLHREVALKFVTKPTAIARSRLIREARAGARINHPNVVAVYDVGEIDGEIFVAMELVDGCTLDEWLAAGPSGPEIVSAFVQAGRALEAAHRAGVLHRDFKPRNVLVSPDGRVRVADFGLARLLAGGDSRDAPPETAPSPDRNQPGDLTATGTVLGTPAYMSPEQRRGAEFDARSDQFSFAVALYEALTREHPYQGGGEPAADEPRELRRFPARSPGVRGGVIDVVVRGLALDPDQRWPSMTAFLRQLERQAGLTRPLLRRRWPAVAVAVVGATALTLAVWMTARSRGEARSTAPAAAAQSKPRVGTVVRLTSDPGCERYPAFSADGQTVYYAGDVDGDSEIFGIDVATRARRRISREAGQDAEPRLSPDGRRLAWTHGLAGSQELRILRLDVADAAPIAAGAGNWIEWATDSTILTSRSVGSIAEVQLDAQGGRVGAHTRDSLDDVRIIDARRLRGDTWLLAVLVTSLGEARLLRGKPGGPWATVELADWYFTADSGLAIGSGRDSAYFVGRLNETTRALMRWSASSGRVDPLRLPDPGYGVDVARDGARLVYSTCLMRSWIARVDPGGGAPVTVLSSMEWDAQTPVPLAGGRLLVTSDRNSGIAVWSYDLASGKGEPISPPTAFTPAASRDGRVVAFINQPGDVSGLFVVDVSTGVVRQLTSDMTDHSPRFGHDTDAVYALRGTEPHVIRVALIDGTVSLVTEPGVLEFAMSPVDDRLVVVQEEKTGERLVWVRRFGEMPRRLDQLPPALYSGPAISPDGKRLVIVRRANELVEVDLDGRAPARTLLQLDGTQTMWDPAYRLDGEGVFVSISGADGDLMVVDGSFP